MEVEYGHFCLANYQADWPEAPNTLALARSVNKGSLAAAAPFASSMAAENNEIAQKSITCTPAAWRMTSQAPPPPTGTISLRVVPVDERTEMPVVDSLAVPAAAPPARIPETSLALTLASVSITQCTSNEPALAPANPVPLPSSRFFVNPRGGLRSLSLSRQGLASRPPAVRSRERATTVPPPRPVMPPETQARTFELGMRGGTQRAAPERAAQHPGPASLASPAVPSAPPPTALSLQSRHEPTPVPEVRPLRQAPRESSGTAEAAMSECSTPPLPPPSQTPHKEMELGAAAEPQQSSVEHIYGADFPEQPREQLAPTPERQSSTCSTDTPGKALLLEQSPHQPGEDLIIKACQRAEAEAPAVDASGRASVATEATSREAMEVLSCPLSDGRVERVEPAESKPDSPRLRPCDSGASLLQVETVHQNQKQVILADIEGATSLVCSSLDKFFDDDRMWQRVSREVAGLSARAMSSSAQLPRPAVLVQASTSGTLRDGGDSSTESKRQALRYFRVQVPRPYPGVQYRKSKRLDDRYPRFAEKGSIVEGVIEDDDWLRTNGHGYLPMKVGGNSVIVPLNPDAAAKRAAELLESQHSWCFCGAPAEPPWPPEDFTLESTTEEAPGDQPDPYRKI